MVVGTFRSRFGPLAVAVMAMLALLAGLLVATSGQAHASPIVPSWEPDSHALGPVTLYDASGTKITSGTLASHPFAAYFAGSGGATPNTPASPGSSPKATTWAYKPVPGSDPVNWSGDTLTAATVIGASGSYPGALANSTLAIAKGVASDFSFNDFMDEYAPLTTGNDAYLYELRVSTGFASEYYRTDISVDPVAGTWTVVYPSASPVTTTTVVSGPTTGTVGSAATYTASVVAASGSPAGTVQFKVDGTNLGSAVSIAAAASPGVSYTPANTSPHTITATFTPTDSNAFTTSSDSVGKTITATAPPTETKQADASAMTLSPTSSSVVAGSSATLSSVLTDSATNTPISGASVQLLSASASAGPFTAASTATTSASGAVTFAVSPTSTTYYKVSYAGDASHGATAAGFVTVIVTTPTPTTSSSPSPAPSTSTSAAPAPAKRAVTIAATAKSIKVHKATKIFGHVAPASAGGTVTLYKLVGKKWVKAGSAAIKQVKLPNGQKVIGYVFSFKGSAKGAFSFRVMTSATASFLAATSAVLKITVKKK